MGMRSALLNSRGQRPRRKTLRKIAAGLALAICKNIPCVHHGKLWVSLTPVIYLLPSDMSQHVWLRYRFVRIEHDNQLFIGQARPIRITAVHSASKAPSDYPPIIPK